MQKGSLVYNFQADDSLRQSLNKLTMQTFGFSFEPWYQRGYWSEQCVPYAYQHHGEVIASLTANKMDLIINGEQRKAIQIGTVITRPDYRHQGLSAALIHKVLETYEKDYDLIYLFTNRTVLDFYPRFGFRRVETNAFSLDLRGLHRSVRSRLRQLDPNNPEDLKLIYQIAAQRRPISQIFSAENAQNLFMFYCINIFPDDIYLCPHENMVVIYRREDKDLHLYDLVSSGAD